MYRVIHKSLRDFRPVRYSSRDGHAEGDHVNRGRDTPSFCPTLQVLDMSTLGDALDVNPVIKFLPYTLQLVWQVLDYKIDICRETKGGHIEHLQGGTEIWSASPSVDMLIFGLTICTAGVGNPRGTYELPCVRLHSKFILHIVPVCFR